MEILRKIVPAKQWSIKCPYKMTPTRVVIHNTANDASAENEISYMSRNGNEVSFHYAVDDKMAVQGIDENRNTWNAGDGVNGKGNREGIAIEICYSKSGGSKFKKAEQNAAKLTADILKRYGWGIEKVTKHQDYNGKYCPHRTLDMGWTRFLNMVKESLGTVKKEDNTSSSANKNTDKQAAYAFQKGDQVRIKGTGKAGSTGGATAFGIGWKREVLQVVKGAKYPYRIGNNSGTTGYYKESALAKVKASPKVESYTVKKGDTLIAIAKKYNTTAKKLADYNAISNPNVIVIGQKIKIPK